MADLETTIRKLIVREILCENDESCIEFDYPLLETGTLDSAGIIHLVLLLDKEFSVSIPPDDLVPEHFETVYAITDYLKTRISSPIN